MLELKYHLLLAATGCKISNSVQRTHCKINQNAARRQNEILTRAIATSIVTYRVCVFFCTLYRAYATVQLVAIENDLMQFRFDINVKCFSEMLTLNENQLYSVRYTD